MNQIKTHNTSDAYKRFKQDHPYTDITYVQYKYIISLFFKKITLRILQGAIWEIGKNLGKIRIRKIKRNLNKRAVNFNETKKLKAQGINTVVYHDSEYWYRWYWEKKHCRVTNKSVYSFKPTKGKTGNIKALVNILNNDEFAELNFFE